MSEEKMSLGEVARAAYMLCRREQDMVGPTAYDSAAPWEAAAQDVRAAVLVEQAEHGTTDRRVISPEEMRVQHLMAHIEEAIARGLSMSQALRLDVQMAPAIQVAIRDGIIAGIKAWEGR